MESSMMHNTSFSRLPLCSNLLQQCLRSFCTDTQWIYAVFWRILPRNFPPPKWEIGGFPDRTKANKRNWILVWEDGYCDFTRAASGSMAGLQPDLFFKMSHEVYNYGEGLMGKVASDNGHKWVHKDLAKPEQAPSWQSSIDPPRTWEAQFKAGIQTIAVISVCEGLVQLGSSQQMQEDLEFVAFLQRKFNNLLMTLPGSSTMAIALRESIDQSHVSPQRTLERQMSWNESNLERQMSWSNSTSMINEGWEPSKSNHLGHHPSFMQGTRIASGDYTPSMNSLEALLSKLPSVTTFPNTQMHPPNQPLNIVKGYNVSSNVSLGHSSPPLLRTLSAPIGDYWLQESTISSTNVTNSNMMVQSTDPQHQSLLQSQASLGSNSFMVVDANPCMGGEYPYMAD